MCVPALFGVEGLISDELKRLDMQNVRAENGRVLFTGTDGDIARANINLHTGERVLLVVGDVRADSFDALFEGVKAMPWDGYIPADGAFPVKGHALDSKLHSVPDCQRIIKKAVVERLRAAYQSDRLPETGVKYQIQFSIMHDMATLYLDTSGAGLHKRGYRPVGSAAPLRETLAAAIIKLARYRGKEKICDPFCGSGTLVIEAGARGVKPRARSEPRVRRAALGLAGQKSLDAGGDRGARPGVSRPLRHLGRRYRPARHRHRTGKRAPCGRRRDGPL